MRCRGFGSSGLRGRLDAARGAIVHSLSTAGVVGFDIGFFFAYRLKDILARGCRRAVISHVVVSRSTTGNLSGRPPARSAEGQSGEVQAVTCEVQ